MLLNHVFYVGLLFIEEWKGAHLFPDFFPAPVLSVKAPKLSQTDVIILRELENPKNQQFFPVGT